MNVSQLNILDQAQCRALQKLTNVWNAGSGISIGRHRTVFEGNDCYGTSFSNSTVETDDAGFLPNISRSIENNDSVYSAKALAELHELGQAEIDLKVDKRTKAIMSFEETLDLKLAELKQTLTEEFSLRNKLKDKLIEHSISENDLPVTKKIGEVREKYRNMYQIKSKEKKMKKQKQMSAEMMKDLQLRADRLQKFRVIHAEFDHNVEEILRNTKVCDDDVSEVNSLCENMNVIREKSNETFNVDDKDIEAGTMILERAQQIYTKVLNAPDETIDVNIEEVLEESKEEAPQAMAERVEASVSDKNIMDKYVCKESHEFYLERSKKLDHVTGLLKDFKQNPNLKPFRFQLFKALNVPINALCSVTADHMFDKYNKLAQLLRGNAIPGLDMPQDDDAKHLSVLFCMDYLATKLINQGKKIVSAKPESAFTLSSIIIALWAEFPDFGELLLARMMKACPYVIPAYWPHFEGQSNKEYYLSLGYAYNDDGSIEDQNKFLKKISGVIRLYAAIIVSEPRRNQHHPHGLIHGWKWLAAILNLEPFPDITATIICEFLEVTGFKLSQTYGRQFQKVVYLLCTDYFQKIENVTLNDCRGPVIRLKTFLESVLKSGVKFQKPEGFISADYW